MKKEQTKESLRNLGSMFLRLIRHVLFHNGWFKLLAVVISVVLWAGLISQDATLTRDKSFQNVNVSINGADALRRSGYIVTSDMETLLNDVSIVAAVPQQQFDTAESSAYNLRVDLSRINATGSQDLRILSTNSTLYGKVVSTNPSTIKVDVDEYKVRQRIPVSLSVKGEIPEGWYMNTPTVDPALITVSGPKSLVQNISRARVFLDADRIEWTEGTSITSADIQLYTLSGEEVRSTLLGITSDSLTIDSVLIETTMMPTKTFDVKDYIKTTGSVAKGYTLKEIRISPESITIAARSEVLQQMNELSLDGSVNLKNLKETAVFQLKVQKPSDDAVISNETVTVTAEVAADDDVN